MTVAQYTKRQMTTQFNDIMQQFSNRNRQADNPSQTADSKRQFIQDFDQLLLDYNALGADEQRQQTLKELLSPTVTVQTNALLHHSHGQQPANDKLLSIPLRGAALRATIRKGQWQIRELNKLHHAGIEPRTQAHNRKQAATSIEEEREYRSDILADQIKSWRQLLPGLLKKFAKIPDPRHPEKIKHQLTTLMMFGLFAFVFRLSSRREMNRELTGPVIHAHLQAIFPDIETIPHADTLARLLERIKPHEIEKAHIHLIKDLINRKKFKKLLINGCLPITIDGTQKLWRNDLLQDNLWCERKVGKSSDDNKQQFIYAIEANITLKNNLNIPLMTEYLRRENNQLEQRDSKQDNEGIAFKRLAKRLKQYFPRLKIIIFGDAMYATQDIMGILHKNHWEYTPALQNSH